MFLSGYLTNTDITDVFNFYQKRIKRILIPYVIWSVIYSLARREPSEIFLNLLTTHAIYHFYYVFVYIQFVLLTPFLKRTLKSPYHWLGWMVAPISTLLFSYTRFFTDITQNRFISFFWSVSCLGWFTAYYLGLALGNRVIHKTFSAKKLLFLYLVSLPIQMIEGHFWFLYGVRDCGTQLKLSAFLTNALFLLLAYCYLSNEEQSANLKPLILLGDSSFGIYLCHVLWIALLKKLGVSLPYLANSFLILLLSFVSVEAGKRICGPRLSKCLGLV